MQPESVPFPHLILDDFLPVKKIAAAARTFPLPNQKTWVRYDSPLERKWSLNDLSRIPNPIADLFRDILQLPVGDWFGKTVIADVGLWGGGLHCMGRGDFLDLHLDASHHPFWGWRRALNGILFLDEWQEEWGGPLEFWNKDRSACVSRVFPCQNRLVIFETSDRSYHGIPMTLTCPKGTLRRTLTAWWYEPIVAESPQRLRANFVGLPGENNPAKEKLRAERAKL